MTTILQDFSALDDFTEARRRLGEMINLGEPAPEAVTRRAMLDERFAFYLMMTKDSPELQKQLLEDERTKAYQQADFTVQKANETVNITETKASTADPSAVSDHGNIELIGKATMALFTWGKTGFQRADEEVVERRWAACQGCEFLTDPPKTMMYQGIKLLAGKGTKICSACGCAVNKKVLLPTEKCPKQDPANPELSRWGEPWVGLTNGT